MSTFFKSIEQIAGQVELQFNIKAKDGILTVMVTPKAQIKDSAFSNMKPLFISGSADELDNEFLEAIAKPLEKAAGIIHNIATFEAGTEKLAKENDAAKKQAELDKKEKEARLKKYAALMGKVDAFEKEKDLKGAIGALKQAKEFTDKPTDIDKRIADVTAKLSQGSIFDQSNIEEDKTDYLSDYNEPEVPETNAEEVEASDIDNEENQEGGEE